jgi:ATP-dependent Lon protease
MPASRWNSGILDMLNWLYDEENDLEEITVHPIIPRQVGENEAEDDEVSPDDSGEIPAVLPVLPLRGLVVYPQTAVPLTIGQARSIRLVDEVMTGDERLIALVTSRDPELEEPAPDDLYPIGTVAMVHRLFRAQDGAIRLVVQGIARFRLVAFVQEEPYLKAQIELIPEEVGEGIEMEALARNARTQFERIAELIPSIPRELVSSVLALEDPLQTAYTIANFQRMELQESQAILEMDSAGSCTSWPPSWRTRSRCWKWASASRTRPAPRSSACSATTSCASRSRRSSASWARATSRRSRSRTSARRLKPPKCRLRPPSKPAAS